MLIKQNWAPTDMISGGFYLQHPAEGGLGTRVCPAIQLGLILGLGSGHSFEHQVECRPGHGKGTRSQKRFLVWENCLFKKKGGGGKLEGDSRLFLGYSSKITMFWTCWFLKMESTCCAFASPGLIFWGNPVAQGTSTDGILMKKKFSSSLVTHYLPVPP